MQKDTVKTGNTITARINVSVEQTYNVYGIKSSKYFCHEHQSSHMLNFQVNLGNCSVIFLFI